MIVKTFVTTKIYCVFFISIVDIRSIHCENLVRPRKSLRMRETIEYRNLRACILNDLSVLDSNLVIAEFQASLKQIMRASQQENRGMMRPALIG